MVKKGVTPDSLPIDGRYQSYLSQGEWKLCKRRATRIDIHASACKVTLTYPHLQGVSFHVATIAELGARYLTGNVDVSRLKGHLFKAQLRIGDQSHSVLTRLLNVGNGSASMEFIDPPQPLRQLIRELFRPELMAATLAPFHSFTSLFAGPTHTTIYSDGDTNRVELLMKNDCLESVKGELDILGIRFAWSRNHMPTFAPLEGKGELKPKQKEQLISFFHNLPDLNPKIQQTLEQVIRN